MKKSLLLFIITAVIVIGVQGVSFAQDLGIIANVGLYGQTGITSSGTSTVTGNVAIGYPATGTIATTVTTNGVKSLRDAITVQDSTDLAAAIAGIAFITKNTTASTSASTTALGGTGANAETLTSATVTVYNYLGDVALAGTLTLSGSGIFIFNIAGALNIAQKATINATSACNVYWIVNGAILGVGGTNTTTLKGSFISTGSSSITLGKTYVLEGRLLAQNNSINLDNLSAAISTTCTGIYWSGAAGSSTWTNGSNWVGGTAPTSATSASAVKIFIPPTLGTTSLVFPTLTADFAVGNISIQPPGKLDIGSNKLQIYGALTSSATVNATLGTVEMSGSAAQTLPQHVFTMDTVNNLIITNTVGATTTKVVTLNGTLNTNVKGKLSFGSSNNTLVTGGLLTLVSMSTGTAQVADITSAGAISGNTISGNVNVQRYIPKKRAWVLLAAPITTSSSQTINGAWQEGVTNATASTVSNPNPLYGVNITGGTNANGYDIGVNLHPSILYYNNTSSTPTFTALPTTASATTSGTNVPISSYPGYFLFVRGNRSTALSSGVNAATSVTTLRMTGNINTNIQSPTIYQNTTANPNMNTLVGNPYPAAIDFASIYKNNSSAIKNFFYVWDPQLAGTYGFGGYVTVAVNTTTTSGTTTTYTYKATPNVTSGAATNVSQYIASGAAFFVQSATAINSGNGTLNINEADKNSSGSDNVFRKMGSTGKELRVNLFGLTPTDSTGYLIDGVLTNYARANVNIFNNDDAPKMYNLGENICINRYNQLLAVESRQTINVNDTTFLKIYNLKKQTYKLSIAAENMDDEGLYAVLKDKYDATLNNTVIDLNGQKDILFTVNADAGSYADDRFNIVFGKGKATIMNFTKLKAAVQQKNIVVDWENPLELDLKEYEVETSANGTDFNAGITLPAKLNKGTAANYCWLDLNATNGMHYYRIGYTDIYGRKLYSSTVKVMVDKAHPVNSINAYPNIIKDNVITYQLNNVEAGTYAVKLYGSDGQLINNSSISHNGNNSSVYSLRVNNNLVIAKYTLHLSSKTVNLTTSVIKD